MRYEEWLADLPETERHEPLKRDRRTNQPKADDTRQQAATKARREFRRDLRRSSQTMPVRPERDQRAHVAWCKRGSDRRWRVYHRCQFTGKVGVPLVIGRGREAETKARATVSIMQAVDLQTATVIEQMMR